MKRILTILSLVMLFNIVIFKLNTYAKVGDVIGKIYSTDIVCDIDGMKIPSYNIGSETAISIEELRNYGFDVKWSENDRKLYVTTMELPDIVPEYELSKSNNVGQIIGNIYETDINVSFNSYLVNPEKTYNIGGKTLVSVEELGDVNSSYEDPYLSSIFPMVSRNSFEGFGYSKYRFKTEWNESNRTISLKTLRVGSIVPSDIGDMKVKEIKPFIKVDAYEFQKYLTFLNVVDALNLEYTFNNNILIVNQTESSGDSYEQEIYGTNKGFINVDLMCTTVDTLSGEKIDGFIDSSGQFRIKFSDLAKISGYNHYYEQSTEILSKK